MAADFKSHVLLRDEKGFFGIPFKRLLLAGVSSGLSYTLLNLFLPQLALPLAFITAVGIVVLLGTRGGLPLWQRGVYGVRGALLLAAVRDADGLFGQVGRALELPVELVRLDAAHLFVSAHADEGLDLREWVTFAQAAEADREDGLVFVDAPTMEVQP